MMTKAGQGADPQPPDNRIYKGIHRKAVPGVRLQRCSRYRRFGVNRVALGGSYQQIVGAISNMVGAISGMVCDGAKGGCSYKLSTAAREAVIQAYLAVNGIIISEFDGIIGDDVETTIKNLGVLSKEGMKDMDGAIIRIMRE